jgi:hypothetical protein
MTPISENAAVAAYLTACEAATERQLDDSHSGGIFAHLCLPLPESTEEWEALKRWLDRLQERTSRFITIEFRAPPHTAACAPS